VTANVVLGVVVDVDEETVVVGETVVVAVLIRKKQHGFLSPSLGVL
jgi:hypothetical protein